MNLDKIRPILDPLLNLLRSRKFLVGFATVIVDMLIVALPALAEAQEALITVVTVVGSILIGAIAWEDVGRAKAA